MLNDKNITYAKLKDICELFKGEQLNINLLSDEYEYPVYNGGTNPSGYWKNYNTLKNSIIISQGGCSAGYVNWINVNFWASAHCFVIKNPSNQINYRYLFFYLKFLQDKLYDLQIGGGIPGISKESLLNVEIIFPSLETQNKIVSILDQFNNLTTNLQDGIPAEIKLRKEQYHYYLKQLLNFNNQTK